MINILYSLLTYGIPDSAVSGYYAKRRDFVLVGSRQKELIEKLMPEDPENRLRVACFICSEALHTLYGQEIAELDSNNTYFAAGRDPSKPLNDQAENIGALLPRAGSASKIRYLLDNDIADRLVVPTSIEIAAAACLQLLRETLCQAA